MTVLETSEHRRANCIFVSDWICNVEVDEIPIEVCRLCLEARRTHATESAKTVTRPINEATESRINQQVMLEIPPNPVP
jgi:hypothetical protein